MLLFPFVVAFRPAVVAGAVGLVGDLGDAVAAALPSLVGFFGLPGTHSRDFMSQCLNWLDPGIFGKSPMQFLKFFSSRKWE